MQADGTEMEAVKWRQGDLVAESITSMLVSACIDFPPSANLEKPILCVISQSCDIVAPEGKEPYVELLAGDITASTREYAEMKSPRVLDIPLAEQSIRFSIHDRFRVKKDNLFKANKHETIQLNTSQRDILRRWIASRYIRSAFPDSFNRRLNDKHITKLLQSQYTDSIFSVMVEVQDEELAETEPYNIQILVHVADGLSKAQKDRIEHDYQFTFSALPGIEVSSVRVSTEDDITMRDLRLFRKLEYDSVSMSEDRDASIEPPETGIW